MLIVDVGRLVSAVSDEGAVIGRRCRAHPDDPVRTCPDWVGAELLAHCSGFARYLPEIFAGRLTPADAAPEVEPPDALRYFGSDLRVLTALLRRTDPATEVAHWASAPPAQAGFWIRRAAHEFVLHRVDADTLVDGTVDPTRLDGALAHDGVEEYFDAFVDTAFATGAAPEIEATLVVELTDRGRSVTRDLPHPGPVTTLRGTAAEMLLAIWHRRDLLAHFVSGDRAIVEGWPRI